MAVQKFDKRLKSILARRKAVSEEALSDCLSKAEDGDQSLSEVLVESGSLSEDDLLTILSEETHLPPINVYNVQPDDGLVTLLPENLATYYGVVPVSKLANTLTLAVSNPFDILQLDDIQIVTGCDIRPVLSTDFSINKAIPEIYNRGQQMVDDLLENMDEGDVEVKEAEAEVDEMSDIFSTTDDAGQAPVVKLVNLIVVQGIKKKASDIHIEPMEKSVRVRYRIDGVCHEALKPPKKMLSALVSRIKIMCGLDIAEKRKPQDGKFQIRLDGRKIDFRVSTLPLIHGEKVVLRILDSSNLSLSLASLGFEERALEDIRNAISKPFGMLLVTGPTGSGKSTTLYSSVREVLCPEDNIVTVEDPVEYQLEGVNQVQVNVKAGMTFAAALRSILRQDPDTVLLGEIRDQETVEIAVKAALTGHLVFSTLHTNDAPSTITRMIDMGVDPFLVASAVAVVCAQRLARKLCDDCKRPMEIVPPKDSLLRMGFTEEQAESAELYDPVGCTRCAQGYKGRFAILETMPVTTELQRIIINGGSALDIKAGALEQEMITLRKCGILNALRGRTTIEELLRVTIED